MIHLPLPSQSIPTALKRLGTHLSELARAATLEVGWREADFTTPVPQPIEELGALVGCGVAVFSGSGQFGGDEFPVNTAPAMGAEHMLHAEDYERGSPACQVAHRHLGHFRPAPARLKPGKGEKTRA